MGRLDYNLGNEDHIAFNQHSYLTAPGLVKAQNAQRILSIVSVVMLGLFFAVTWELPATLLVFVALGVAIWFLWPHYLKATLSTQLKQLGSATPLSVTGPVTLTWDEHWLTQDAPGWRTSVAWQRVLRVEETAGHVFVILAETEAFIIPKSAGPQVAEFGRWLGARQFA